MKESKLRYNPSLSVKANAQKNGVTEDAVRYYIRSHGIDRRYDGKVNIVESIRKYLGKYPDATKTDVARRTGHGINTVRRYWDFARGVDNIEQFKNGDKIAKKRLRDVNDFYATHPSCVKDILRVENFGHFILEPFCGIGSISEVLKEYGREVTSYDIVDRGYGKVGNFFDVDFEESKYDIISNPPYNENLIDIVKRCIKLCHEKVALLMPLRYLSGEGRYREIYRKFPPMRVYVYQERINIAKNADFETYNDAGANLEIYAWYVWKKGYKGATTLRWIRNDKNGYKESTIITVEQELKEKIDELILVEHRNTESLLCAPSYFRPISKTDISLPEKTQYDMSKYCCIAFRSKNDYWKDYAVPFGNMNGGYPYQICGVSFPTSEHAYIFGRFSSGTEEHNAIQKELLDEPRGYMAKRDVRRRYRDQGRSDWYEFNREWMLYVVWQKIRQREDFRELIMALPKGTAIIEDVSFKPKDDGGADFWGARNPDKKAFEKMVRQYSKFWDASTK